MNSGLLISACSIESHLPLMSIWDNIKTRVVLLLINIWPDLTQSSVPGAPLALLISLHLLLFYLSTLMSPTPLYLTIAFWISLTVGKGEIAALSLTVRTSVNTARDLFEFLNLGMHS